MSGGEMQCPKCGARQPSAAECRHCGVIVAKVRAGGERPRPAAPAPPPAPPKPAAPPRLPLAGLWRAGTSPRDKATLFAQVGRMLASGLPLVRTLESAAASVSGRRVRALCARLVHRLQEGATLAAAMGEWPRDFDPHEVGAVRAAESVGELPATLGALAERLERRTARWRRVAVGLTYPLVLLNLSFFLLPVASLALGRTEDYLRQALTPVGLFVGVLLGALLLRGHVLSHPAVGAWLRRALAAVPGLSTIYRRFAIATFYDHLARTLRAGLAPEPALRAAAGASAHPGFVRAVERSVAALDGGASFAQALRLSGLAADAELLVLTGGEESGELDESLTALAREAEARLDTSLQILVKLAVLVASMLILGFVGLRIFEGMQAAMGAAEQQILKELPGHLNIENLDSVRELLEGMDEALAPGYQPIQR